MSQTTSYLKNMSLDIFSISKTANQEFFVEVFEPKIGRLRFLTFKLPSGTDLSNVFISRFLDHSTSYTDCETWTRSESMKKLRSRLVSKLPLEYITFYSNAEKHMHKVKLDFSFDPVYCSIHIKDSYGDGDEYTCATEYYAKDREDAFGEAMSYATEKACWFIEMHTNEY